MNCYMPWVSRVLPDCASQKSTELSQAYSKETCAHVLPPRPMLTFAIPSDPSARPFCSSRLGEQFVNKSDVRSISASLSFSSSCLWCSIKARTASSVEVVNDIVVTIYEAEGRSSDVIAQSNLILVFLR